MKIGQTGWPMLLYVCELDYYLASQTEAHLLEKERGQQKHYLALVFDSGAAFKQAFLKLLWFNIV